MFDQFVINFKYLFNRTTWTCFTLQQVHLKEAPFSIFVKISATEMSRATCPIVSTMYWTCYEWQQRAWSAFLTWQPGTVFPLIVPPWKPLWTNGRYTSKRLVKKLSKRYGRPSTSAIFMKHVLTIRTMMMTPVIRHTAYVTEIKVRWYFDMLLDICQKINTTAFSCTQIVLLDRLIKFHTIIYSLWEPKFMTLHSSFNTCINWTNSFYLYIRSLYPNMGNISLKLLNISHYRRYLDRM